jgi:hypothetical protein
MHYFFLEILKNEDLSLTISIIFYILEIMLIAILTVFLHKHIDKDTIEESQQEKRNLSS